MIPKFEFCCKLHRGSLIFEQISKSMKQKGVFIARQLSLKDVTVEMDTAVLGNDQRIVWNRASQLVSLLKNNLRLNNGYCG